MLEDALTTQVKGPMALSILLLPLLYVIYTRLTKTPTVFDQLPWAGLPNGRFAQLRAKFTVTSKRDAIREASERYSSKGKAFVWQEFLGQPMVVLPASMHRWLLDQPHDIISGHEYFTDSLALDISLMDPQVHNHPLHVKVITNNLNRALSWTSGPVMDELSKCFNEDWGFSSEWQEHVVWSDFMKVVARTVNRMFIGCKLCRNQEFLDGVVQYATIFIMQGLALRPLPQFVRNILSLPVTIPIRLVFNKLYKQLKPIMDQRKADFERKQADPDYEYEEPNDLLQWLITSSYASPDAKDREARIIAKRFLAINFAAVHTTTMNSTALVFDLASTDPKDNTIGQIRDQIATVYKECKGKWDKASLAKLSLLDSAVRETLRLSGGGGAWTPSRKVMAKNGVTLPNGLHLDYGMHLCLPSWGVHHASESDFTYDPFRWARSRTEHGIGGNDADLLKERNLQATATGLNYLPFGHGRDACPGRFFAVQEIKLMMVHLLLNYEIKPLEKRPADMWISDMPSPPRDAKITVRKIAPPLLD